MEIQPPKYKKFEDFFPNGLVEKEKVTTIVPDDKIPVEMRNIVMTQREVDDLRVNFWIGLLGVATAIIFVLSYLYFMK